MEKVVAENIWICKICGKSRPSAPIMAAHMLDSHGVGTVILSLDGLTLVVEVPEAQA